MHQFHRLLRSNFDATIVAAAKATPTAVATSN
jgi:hypothetical protein